MRPLPAFSFLSQSAAPVTLVLRACLPLDALARCSALAEGDSNDRTHTERQTTSTATTHSGGTEEELASAAKRSLTPDSLDNLTTRSKGPACATTLPLLLHGVPTAG